MTIEIKSEVAGTVFELVVQAGDRVSAGDTLLVMESMKMEIPIESSAAGTVAALLVDVGDVVASGQILARLEVED